MKDTKEACDSSSNKTAGNPNAPERKPRKHPRQFTLVEKRSLEASVSIATETLEQIAFQHTVLCQTCMPYRNPGDEVRVWKRKQGSFFCRNHVGNSDFPPGHGGNLNRLQGDHLIMLDALPQTKPPEPRDDLEYDADGASDYLHAMIVFQPKRSSLKAFP